jgi:hypothetical protein
VIPTRTATLLACLLLPAAAGATAIDVITMGEGDDLFSHFGHAAICVSGETSRCYNYGTTDFSTPGPLTWDFVRGRALFWVSVTDLPHVVAAYRAEDRTVWRQRLPLGEEKVRAIAARLEASTAPGMRTYRYHHFDDNCSTRVRDVIEAELPGSLGGGAPGGPTFRDDAERGFRSSPLLLAGTSLLLGRRADRVPTPRERLFLPAALREQVRSRFGVEPEVLHERRAPLPGGAPAAGRWALGIAGLALGLLAAGGRRSRAAVLAAVPAGLVALVPWVLAVASPLPELRWNEVLLVLWPTDLALPLLPAGARRRYLDLRLAALALLLLARVAGVLVQPLAAPVLLVLPALVALRLPEQAPRGPRP